MKRKAVISTLLDRQTLLLEGLLKEYPVDIITPKQFADQNQLLANKYGVQCHVIEYQLSDEEISNEIKNKETAFNQRLDASVEDIQQWLKKEQLPHQIAEVIQSKAKSRTAKILTLYMGLNKLKASHDILALAVNQEYMIHEATLVQWAKYNEVPSIHFCHSPYIARNLGSIRHFISDHLTLTTERCKETLDDLNTGKGQRHVTGMVNWDAYRSINTAELEALKSQLEIPADALVISYFTTYAVHENATSDPLTYEKTLDAFMDAAAEVNKNTDRSLFFIVKDRPSGTKFSKEQVHHKAKRLGISDNFAYIFDRPEKIVLISDITISPGSSIAVESMAMGKATVELVSRQVFLGGLLFSADDGVVQCDAKGLHNELYALIHNDIKRTTLADKSASNLRLVEETQQLEATHKSLAKLLEIIGETEHAERIRNDPQFYDALDTAGEDHRFIVNSAFQSWRAKTQPDELTGQLMGERYNQWKKHPTFHLVLVLDESLFEALATTLDSLELQIYPHYGLSILSSACCPIDTLHQAGNIQWIQTPKPFEDINPVIREVEADWIMQLWPGDELHPQALFNLADYADLNNDWLAIYGDEALLQQGDEEMSDDESRFGANQPTDPIFKPDFNLDLLRSTDYVSRATAFRKDAWEAMEGFAPFAYRQTEDLVFRIAERMTLPAIGHIPNILVSRSVFTAAMQQSEDHEKLGALIRQQHLTRCGFSRARVQPGLHPGIYNTRYFPEDTAPAADFLLPTPKLTQALADCLISLAENTALKDIRPYIAVPAEQQEFQEWWQNKNIPLPNVQLVTLASWQGEADALQRLISASSSDVFVLASSQLRFVQSNWLETLLDQLQRPDVAMAAPRLVSSKATIVSAGQILGKDGLIGDLYSDFFLEQEVTGLPRAWCEQSFNALHPACLAIKRKKYNEIGMLDPEFKTRLAVNDLQIRMCIAGHKLIWSPLSSVALTGRNNYLQVAGTDRTLFKQRWFNLLITDPAFNANLALRDSGLEADILLAGKWHFTHHQRPRVLACIFDPSPRHTQITKKISGFLQEGEKKEWLQIQRYGFLSGGQTLPLSATEVARLHPDLCIYSGNPDAHVACIKDLATYTQIKQWALLTSTLDLEAWQNLQDSLTGWLVTDPKLYSKISDPLEKVLLAETMDEIKPERVELWLEQVFE
ncbi:MAG: hypothetical protein IBX50_15755 [Marinospirillum sp.]|uniref:hypothetical protein n=1 Tax=Marinospirillum sp. TaxID=2183934 RepID=UPI0019F0B1A5|nr:hypothetical protein [Marinospirillum sp.]MBE0508144.1 hypothetical protein [Marinospirillum sp.]